jgi:two-component system, NtrC family, sensor histidine kinase HydH
MFDPDYELPAQRGSQWAIAWLALLSLLSLLVIFWVLAELPREQQIVQQLTQHLPAADRAEANELAGGLQLQSRLSVLLIVNAVASGFALTLLVRAYFTSQRSLRNVHVAAADVLASLDQGVITTDERAAILSMNPSGRELLAPQTDGTELALSALSPDHRPLEEMCREVLEKQNHIRDRDYVSRRNGADRHLRAGCSLLRDHTGMRRGTVIHLRDVTEKTLMEQQLRRMERYMGLGSLAAGLQHEIKNPLSALSLHVQLLKESLEQQQTPPTAQESLKVLVTEVRRITNVLESFQDFASVARLNPTATDVPGLIRKLIALIEPQARLQNVVIQAFLPAADVAPISIDALRIEQVLLNLILNALTAMKAKPGGTLTIRLRDNPGSVEIEVADTGCGIAKDLRDKIFDPYFTTSHTGTGMGLALCEKIVRQHDGTIDFTSGTEGTVFTVLLPRSTPS